MPTTKELGVRPSDPGQLGRCESAICLVRKLGVHRAAVFPRSFRRLSLPFLRYRLHPRPCNRDAVHRYPALEVRLRAPHLLGAVFDTRKVEVVLNPTSPHYIAMKTTVLSSNTIDATA